MKKKSYLWLLAILFIASISIESCKKDDDDDTPDPVEDPTKVKDIDGNVYNVIQIGNQYWMKENLRVSKFRNGNPITNRSDGIAWKKDTIPSLGGGGWCYFNNEQLNDAVYGKLYNYYAISDPRNIAPEGWHVATEVDWKTLIHHLGDSTLVGGYLKEAGVAHWFSPNTGATNSSNFTGLPGGKRDHMGNFTHNTIDAFFWTTKSIDNDYALFYNLDFMISGVYSYTALKKNGFSVRCVKD